MRNPTLFLLGALCVALVVTPARAGDEPIYDGDDIALEPEYMPDGWTLDDDDEIAEALEAFVEEVASADPDLDVDTVERVVRHADLPPIPVVLVTIDGNAEVFAKRLESAATGRYGFRRMGSPSRLLLYEAPADVHSALEKAHVVASVRALTARAIEKFELGSRVGAQQYAEGAAMIAPDAGAPQAILGLVLDAEEKRGEAIAVFRKALRDGASIPPEGLIRYRSWRTLGQDLLLQKDASLDAEARDALQAAVDMEDALGDDSPKDSYATHYDLACALSRLDQRDAALGRLGRALTLAKREMETGRYRMFLINHVPKDPDLENIRKDPRYEKVIAESAGEAAQPLRGM